ncbi:MAG: hypothetical protein AB7N80_11440 [Bdellovibrionales bacterium]
MRKTMLTLATMALLPHLAQAEISPAEADNYPVNFARCNYVVTVPEGAGGYLHSRDCKTVYVLPSAKGIFRAQVQLSETLLQNTCSAFELRQRDYLQKSKLLLQAQEKLNELELTGQNQREIERLYKLTERLQNELQKMEDPFRDVEGGKAKFDLQAGVTRQALQGYYNANQQLVYSKQIKFEPMPVQNGYLTMTEYRPNDKTKFPSALAVYANGILVKSEGSEQNIYKMKSAMSGQIVLGMSKACDLYARKKSARDRGITLDEDELGSGLISELAPTFSYTYPVMSTVRYEAVIDVNRATELLLDVQKVKSQFKVSEFAQMLGRGTAGDIFRMEIDLGDLSDRFTTAEDRQTFLAELTADVRNRLSEKMLRELELVSVVKFEKEHAGEVPNPGYEAQPIGVVRTCSSQSFLGIKVRSSCQDRVVTRTIPIDGRLEDTIKKIQDFQISVSEQVSIRELTLHGENVIFE